MHRLIRTSTSAVALLSCMANLSIGAPATALLRQCIANKLARESFSGVVSVEERGQQPIVLPHGVQAGSNSAPITSRTRFNLGSSSKMFTAIAVGQLVDAHRIGWDDPIGKYVVGLTAEAAAVTIRQLLTHSSGLGDFFRPENMQAMLRARTASDILPLIAADKPSFAPGSRFAYSNSGFALLGILIERVSGLTYGDYLQRHIFRPAGMSDSGLDPKPLRSLAVGMTAGGMTMRSPNAGNTGQQVIGPDHNPTPPGDEQPSNGGLVLIGPDGKIQRVDQNQNASAEPALRVAPGAREGYGSPAGGLFSTAADMSRFATAMLENQLVTAATANAITTREIVAAPATDTSPERDYGFGFGVGVYATHRWYGHNGGTLGANAEFAVFPDDGVTITVLSNRDPPVATTMFGFVRGLLFDPAPDGSHDGCTHEQPASGANTNNR